MTNHNAIPPADGIPSASLCERARLAKDARFDGLFFIAVKSTRIYCRPICPAPAPKPANISYFPTAAAASAAGYRPCLRCRPELSPERRLSASSEAMRCTMARIQDGALQLGSVTALARSVGLSARQLQRKFLADIGATPHQVHATQRMLLAKKLLSETSLSITEVALGAGYNSMRRFNAAFLAENGMPPSRLRRASGAADACSPALRLRLAYRPPMDFAQVLGFYAKRAIAGIERVVGNSYERIFGPPEQAARMRISACAVRAELVLELSGVPMLLLRDSVLRVRRMFDLDAEPGAIDACLASEPALADSVARTPGLRIPGAFDGFELAVRAVLGQQISVAATVTLLGRLVQAFGQRRANAEPGFEYCFPTPQTLADADVAQIGLTRARANTLRALAQAVLAGRLSFAAGQRLADFLAAAQAIPGIGAWTANYIALRGLMNPDAFPAGDLIVLRQLGLSRGAKQERIAIERAEAWRPWRGYAVLHLWSEASRPAPKMA